MSLLNLGPLRLDFCEPQFINERVRDLIKNRLPTHIITFNSLMFNHAIADSQFSNILSSPAVAVADSIGIIWAIKFLTGNTVARRPGIDLIDDFCLIARQSGFRIFLLGGKPGIAEAASQKLKSRFPGIEVAGTYYGYFEPHQENDLISKVINANPDILLVAMSSPRQEKWINSKLNLLGVPLVIGVGGSFDVISGALKRAPVWMRKSGSEWLFRLIQQPWRIFRILNLSVFVLNVLKLKFFCHSRENGNPSY